MSYKIFIDGEAGTTGLQVRDRLMAHPEVSLIQLDEKHRKESSYRYDAMDSSEVTILCLPDDSEVAAAYLAAG